MSPRPAGQVGVAVVQQNPGTVMSSLPLCGALRMKAPLQPRSRLGCAMAPVTSGPQTHLGPLAQVYPCRQRKPPGWLRL